MECNCIVIISKFGQSWLGVICYPRVRLPSLYIIVIDSQAIYTVVSLWRSDNIRIVATFYHHGEITIYRPYSLESALYCGLAVITVWQSLEFL